MRSASERERSLKRGMKEMRRVLEVSEVLKVEVGRLMFWVV